MTRYAIAAALLLAAPPTDGTWTVSGEVGITSTATLFEFPMFRGDLTFFGAPCDGRFSMCLNGTWRYHQPDGSCIVIGNVDSAGRFTASNAVCP